MASATQLSMPLASLTLGVLVYHWSIPRVLPVRMQGSDPGRGYT